MKRSGLGKAVIGFWIVAAMAIADTAGFLAATERRAAAETRETMTDISTVDVAIRTRLGTIVVRLDGDRAPVTVVNFLKYVDAHKYDGTTFYRTVRPGNSAPHRPIQVIQGGLDLPDNAPYPFGKIPLETTAKTGLRFDDGEIGIARDKDPGTGGSEFFITIGTTNRILDSDRSPDRFGYAAFGHVVRGMDVVRRIQRAPAKAQRLNPPVAILSIRRLPNEAR
jgi:peptidyl-prolyl cis-trans isomerase A (cyclophilin A)